jgi:2-polyprenyl-3-methyl-5-hydroxy-6-metoxy-1,4-benzoquinol methylase
MQATIAPKHSEDIVSGLLNEFRGNSWFVDQCWPENKHRVLLMLEDLVERKPDRTASVLDVGCANGYITYLFARAGYAVTATDSWHIPERDEMFARLGVQYFPSNLNDLHPFAAIKDRSFDGVICGEVFEHILNHPLGILIDFHRILKPGGVLILTTPNPSTLMNALRVVLDRHTLWGTDVFIEKPKLKDGVVIDQGDIHYREYTTREVTHALETAGFHVDKIRYMGMGIAGKQPLLKKFLKTLFAKTLMTKRLFASNHYFVAVKNA